MLRTGEAELPVPGRGGSLPFGSGLPRGRNASGHPRGLAQLAVPHRIICLKASSVFHRAGWQLSFLLVLLHIFLGFGRLRSPVRLRRWELPCLAAHDMVALAGVVVVG